MTYLIVSTIVLACAVAILSIAVIRTNSTVNTLSARLEGVSLRRIQATTSVHTTQIARLRQLAEQQTQAIEAVTGILASRER